MRHPRLTMIRTLGRLTLIAVALVGISACTSAPAEAPTKAASVTYTRMGDQALTDMITDFYAHGQWKSCASCWAGNQDWGDDAMTYALWLRWEVHHHDASVIPALQGLANTAPSYGPPCAHGSACGQWSDIPMWDSIALGREYEATGSKSATILAKETAAFQTVDGAGSSVYAFGACPLLHYQQPGGGSNRFKTQETDANYIKAALLLYRYTHDPSYLTKAGNAYAAVRRYALDRHLALYSVAVFDCQ